MKFTLLYGYFGNKDKRTEHLWTIQNVNNAISNVLIGIAYNF